MPIDVTFGINTIEYLLDDWIRIPITLSEDVSELPVTSFNVEGVNLADARISGSASGFDLYLLPEPESDGTLTIEAEGAVYPSDAVSISDMDTLSSGVLSVNYNTREPFIVSKQTPSQIEESVFSVYIDFNREVIGLSPKSFITSGINTAPKIYAAETPDTALQIGERPSTYKDYSNSETPRRYYRLDFGIGGFKGSINIDLAENAVRGYVDGTASLETQSQLQTSEARAMSRRSRAAKSFQPSQPVSSRAKSKPPPTPSQSPPRRARSTVMPPDMGTVANQQIPINEPYQLDINVTGSAINVKVEGLFEGFYYTFSRTDNRIRIQGTADDYYEGIWIVTARNSAGQSILTIGYQVVDPLPVIHALTPAQQNLITLINRNTPFDLSVTIDFFSEVDVSGPLIGLNAEIIETEDDEGEVTLTGVRITGSIPQTSLYRGDIRVVAVNSSGGVSSRTFEFTLANSILLHGQPLYIDVSAVAPISLAQPRGLAFHNGQFYIADGATDALHTLDPATGTTTQVGNANQFGQSIRFAQALASHNGTLYMIDNGSLSNRKLWKLNTTTGVATNAGNLPIPSGRSSRLGGRALTSWNGDLYFANFYNNVNIIGDDVFRLDLNSSGNISGSHQFPKHDGDFPGQATANYRGFCEFRGFFFGIGFQGVPPDQTLSTDSNFLYRIRFISFTDIDGQGDPFTVIRIVPGVLGGVIATNPVVLSEETSFQTIETHNDDYILAIGESTDMLYRIDLT